jgi:hypothetical protein
MYRGARVGVVPASRTDNRSAFRSAAALSAARVPRDPLGLLELLFVGGRGVDSGKVGEAMPRVHADASARRQGITQRRHALGRDGAVAVVGQDRPVGAARGFTQALAQSRGEGRVRGQRVLDVVTHDLLLDRVRRSGKDARLGGRPVAGYLDEPRLGDAAAGEDLAQRASLLVRPGDADREGTPPSERTLWLFLAPSATAPPRIAQDEHRRSRLMRLGWP